MMIQFDPPAATERVKLMIRERRITFSPHRNSAQILRSTRNIDFIMHQAAAEHAHIKRSIVCSKDPAQHGIPDLVPQLWKRRRILNDLRRDPRQSNVERVEMCLRIDQRRKRIDDSPLLDHGDSDTAHAVVIGVRRFHVKGNEAFHQLSLTRSLMFIL